MADLGLLMADPLAQACAEGRKTVTRRPMVGITELQPSPLSNHAWRFRDRHGNIEDVYMGWLGREDFAWHGWTRIPGAGTATVGQRVWVRECFGFGTRPHPELGWWDGVEYRADVANLPGEHHHLPLYAVDFPDGFDIDDQREGWRPSIHMPKWAARTWGTLTSVTPCDLSDIDDAEAQREGFDTAAEFLAVIAKLYPGVRWFWRLEIQWEVTRG